MCARLLRRRRARRRRFARFRRAVPRVQSSTGSALGCALRHRRSCSFCPRSSRSTSCLYVHDAEGILPAAGHGNAFRAGSGRPDDFLPGDAGQARDHQTIVQRGSRGRRTSSASRAGQRNTGNVFVTLNPPSERASRSTRSSRAFAASSGRCPARGSSCSPSRTCASAGAPGNALYQYTLQADDLSLLRDLGAAGASWRSRTPGNHRCEQRLSGQGRADSLVVDRDAAARVGVTPRPSTRRSMIPSASGSSRRFTRRSTSTAW